MTIQLMDTHCHLDFPVFDERREQLLTDAEASGVTKMVVAGVTAATWPRLLRCCEDKRLYPALGLHPCFMHEHREAHLKMLSDLLEQRSVVAVGEVGLDFFIPGADKAAQTHLFEAQLKLAQQFDLPVLLHVRKAHDEVLKQLRRYQLKRGGIVHAYSGSLQQAQQYLALGFKLGIGGTLTYERAKRLRRLVLELPLASFVLETDSPDMPLSGYQGEPNQPGRVRQIAEIFAQLKAMPLAGLARQTTSTARALLQL
ncbi:MAG: TatD family hydrolase [Pontibacterium sp.]